MKKILAAAAAVCALSAVSAYATPFDTAYGNTVTRTNPDGSKTVIYVNADGTWQQITNGQTVGGTYTWKNETTACFVMNPPPAQPMGDGCQDFAGPTRNVGDTWTETGKGPDGKDYTVTMSITAGR
jgi:hypothetical protein